MKGAAIIVKSLEDLGVRHVFGYSGAAILPVIDELGTSSIQITVTANEQGAAFAAAGYSRASDQVGVAIVTDDGNYGNPIAPDARGPWQEFDELLAEPFIRGRELTTAVLGEEALAVTELRPKSGFYDYDAKYTDGMTEHVCPADVPADIRASAMAMALKAHQLLGCKGASRSDFRWDDEHGLTGIYLLEVNTQPGMTQLSLVPEQGRAVGMDYAELVERIVGEALL